MTEINRLWAGRVFGTNTGNLFIEFTETDPNIVGILRFMGNSFGLTVYEISGTYTDKLQLTGKAIQAGENIRWPTLPGRQKNGGFAITGGRRVTSPKRISIAFCRIRSIMALCALRKPGRNTRTFMNRW